MSTYTPGKPIPGYHAHLGMVGDHAECVRLELDGHTILSASRHRGGTSADIRARHKKAQEIARRCNAFNDILQALKLMVEHCPNTARDLNIESVLTKAEGFEGR